MTIQYYQDNAQQFFDGTVNVDMEPLYSRFLKYVEATGKILDAGCGSGRDSKAFLNKGFQVVAMDASKAMVTLANEHTGLTVLHRTFQQVSEKNTYDAIWSCASLLHVSLAGLPEAMGALANSLKPGGYWYVSFKYGDTERVKDGRHFTDLNEVSLTALLAEIGGLSIVESWITTDARPNRHEQWLNAIIHKK